MPRITDRIARAAAEAAQEVETKLLAREGRKSVATKVARAKRTTKKALRAGAIAGAVVAAAVVMRERRKRRKLDA